MGEKGYNMSISVKKLGKSIIYKAVQPVISKSVLPNATRQDDAYKEASVKTEMVINKLATSIRRKGPAPIRPTAEQSKAIQETIEWKRLHRNMEAGQRQKSMAEIMADPTFTNHPDRNPPTPASKVSSAKFDNDGRIIPQAGQWYHFIGEDYWIMYENTATYIMTPDDFGTIKHFCVRIERDVIGNVMMTPLSLGRFYDVLNSSPSIKNLQSAGYKWERLTLKELDAFGSPDFENVIPLFEK
jgi:hypothetical protein